MSQNEKIFQQFQLPKGWRWLKLKDIIREFVNGGTPNTNIPQFWNGGIAWITSADIKNLHISKGRKYISQEGLNNSSTHLVKKDTVLIATRTGVGKVAVAENDLCFSQDITGVVCTDEIFPEFLARYLLSQGDNLIRIQRGATIKGLTREDIESLYIPFPLLLEQRRIAVKIQELMQDVDCARAACEKQLEAAQALPAAYIRQVFESDEAKKWEKKKLSEISEEFVNGGTPNTNMPHYWGGNIPWITSADITNLYVSGGRKSITQEGLNDSSTHLVKKNTVLVATRTGVGKVGIASNDLCFSQDITGIRCRPNILPEFLVRFLIYQSTNLTMIQRGATIKGLTRKDVESTEVLLPSVREQQQIILYLGGKINHIEQLVSKMKNQTEKVYALPHNILKQAFRGEL